jgi:hypothetical protein
MMLPEVVRRGWEQVSERLGTRRTPWLLTALVVLLALSTRLWTALGRPFSEYDPAIALTMFMAITLVWYTHFTRQAVEATGDRSNRERISLATAALFECRPLEARLRQLYQLGRSHPWVTPSTWLSHPMLSRVADRPDLFSRETVQAVAASLSFLEESVLAVSANRTDRSGSPDLSPIQTAAGWAHNRLLNAVERLRAEGGSMPEPGDNPMKMPISLHPELAASPYEGRLVRDSQEISTIPELAPAEEPTGEPAAPLPADAVQPALPAETMQALQEVGRALSTS